MGFLNFYVTKLLTDITAVDTTITLETPPTVPSGRLVLEARNVSQREILSYTSVVGNQIQGVVRGVGGTTAKPHSKNGLVEMNVTAQDLQDLYDAFASFSSTNGSGWITAVTLPSSVVYNGNHSYTITYPVSVASIKSNGTRTRFTRTVTAPTQCTSLNGTNQYFSKTTPSGMTFVDDFAGGAWIYPIAYPVTEEVIESRYNGTSGWVLAIESTGQLRLSGFNAGVGNVSAVQSYQSIPLNKWTHVAAQLDMSTFTVSPTTSYIMIDGVDVPSQVFRAGTNPTALIQAGNLEIGSQNGGLLPFAGKIAQVFVTSAKVTQANMRTIMSQGITSADVTALSMISAYSFNNSINDLNTSNANNLTANNAAVATNVDSPFGNGLGGLLEYGITMNLSANGLTETVQVPTGCAIPTAGGVSAISYSNDSNPYLFPAEPHKHEISFISKIPDNIAFGGINTWYPGNCQLSVPIGAWLLGYQGNFNLKSTVSGVRIGSVALGVTGEFVNGNYSYPTALGHYDGDSSPEVILPVKKDIPVFIPALAVYILQAQIQANSGAETWSMRGDLGATIVYARNGYL